MSKLPKYMKDKIESYMRHSHKANKLRNEIDEWFVSKGTDSHSIVSHWDESYSIDGVIIQNILIDAAQETETTEENIQETIRMIEENF